VTAIDADAFTRLLVEGFAQLLDDAGTGLTWREDLAYLTGETGMYPMSLPADQPSRAVALAPYPLTADPTLSQSEIGLQIRYRSAGDDVRDVWSMSDKVQNRLLGLFPVTLPTDVRVEALHWTSGGSLGRDDSQRFEWGDNFTARVHRPSMHRQ
jgi:hypothetical protein